MWSNETGRYRWAIRAAGFGAITRRPELSLKGFARCPTFRACDERELQFARENLVFARDDPGARPYLIAIDRVRLAL
jgi:hypothetical protein